MGIVEVDLKGETALAFTQPQWDYTPAIDQRVGSR